MTHYVVHIVSQRRLFRKTFSKLLNVLDANIHCEEHDDDFASLEILPASDDGAVLLDFGASKADQITEHLLQLLAINAEAALIVVLDEQQDAMVDAAMNLGAMGVVIKASPPQLIISTLQRILAGERCRPSPVVKMPQEAIPEDMRRQLSARQQKMLRAIMGGQSISDTARQLSITPAKLVSDMREVIATIRGREFP